MMRILTTLLCSLAFLIPSCDALAQAGANTGTKPTSVAPSALMPAGKFYVNTDTIPAPRFGTDKPSYGISCPATDANCTPEHGQTSQDGISGSSLPNCPQNQAFITDCYEPTIRNYYPYTAQGLPANSGSFRITCALSHVSFDDPIVWPHQSGKTHLHQFFGNSLTNAQSDLMAFSTKGNSTCFGGTLNRTGYWVPVIIYHCPSGSTNGCTRSRDGEIQFAKESNFYYKCGNDFGSDCDNIVWYPTGFRMITGNAANTNGGGIPGRYDCYYNAHNGFDPSVVMQNNGNSASYDLLLSAADEAALPSGTPCNEINMLINFPHCWDGVNIDSTDHISHMSTSYGGFSGCTDSSYPQLVPAISMNVHVPINPADWGYLRLSSDQPLATATGTCATAQYNYCAGATLHADWVNGWSTTTNFGDFGLGSITDLIIRQCYGKGYTPKGMSFDCHDNVLGSPLNDNNFYMLNPP